MDIPQLTQELTRIANERQARLQAEARKGGQARTEPYKLGPLMGGFSMASIAPVGIVGLGSSTMAGVGADNADGRWFNKLAAHLRAAFPNGGTESTVGTLSTTRITTPGLHFYNGGVGGATTSDYLPSATAVANKAPRAVLHMIGSNDVMQGVSAATYRTRMEAALDRLDAVVPAPYVNILFQAHPREGSNADLYGAYRAVLQDLASTRGNVVMVDAEMPFRAAGLPLPDTLNLLGPDTTHLTQAGHDMMFRIAAAGLGVPVTGSKAPAPAPAPVDTSQRVTLFTDTFSGGDGALVAGRPVDNGLGGGRAATWAYEGPAGEVTITGGELARPASSGANWIMGVQMPTPDYEWSFRLRARHNSAGLYIVARRAAAVLANTPDDYRLTMETDGWLQLRKRVGGTVSLVGSGSGRALIGDRVGLRVLGDQISVMLNGAVVSTVTDTSLTAPGFIGLSGSGGVAGWRVDDIVATTIIR